MSPELDIKPTSTTSASKPYPQFNEIRPAPIFEYLPSLDGLDSNLLVILHGLGDTEKPFVKLAQKLNLPQTAILTLRGPERVPLLEEDAFQWWESFDLLTGAPALVPNPTRTLNWMMEIIQSLLSPSNGWSQESIHFFGFGQGGSCASESVFLWGRNNPELACLGSLVTASGPLLSLPTVSPEARSPTPTLFWTRDGQDRGGKDGKAFTRGFKSVEKHVSRSTGREEMPKGSDEWQEILQFWSKFLKHRQPWEVQGTLSLESNYEVIQK
ncbi:hypothetical protein BY996DRAFT_6417543 [Phakopsora pachyrhizi]|uniref:Phospholipase/carboxylesterase/thioesterase domain-containing protein n=1 Tax=Phakopsora pachyrhizi TaxID=170000 RepID=A0AAV0BW53_PHAPC|nr:hypothetical protein BY996DRAFT_6417543 [Phakopsora pachyrhizi]CAH7690581.1 hypothetical protein PPACK8108_LOCUS25972 [Phakopsora pachyrhizi]